MALKLIAKGYNREFEIGYFGFDSIRQCIAGSYNEELGEIYAKSSRALEDIYRWNEIHNEDLDLLLLHSDCEGKLSYQECRKIARILDKLVIKYPENYRQDYKEMCYILKDMIQYCAKNRKTLWFC